MASRRRCVARRERCSVPSRSHSPCRRGRRPRLQKTTGSSRGAPGRVLVVLQSNATCRVRSIPSQRNLQNGPITPSRDSCLCGSSGSEGPLSGGLFAACQTVSFTAAGHPRMVIITNFPKISIARIHLAHETNTTASLTLCCLTCCTSPPATAGPRCGPADAVPQPFPLPAYLGLVSDRRGPVASIAGSSGLPMQAHAHLAANLRRES